MTYGTVGESFRRGSTCMRNRIHLVREGCLGLGPLTQRTLRSYGCHD